MPQMRVRCLLDEIELPDQEGMEPHAVLPLLPVIPWSHRPARFPGRPRNGHSILTMGVTFMMSAARLAGVPDPDVAYEGETGPVTTVACSRCESVPKNMVPQKFSEKLRQTTILRTALVRGERG